LAHVEIVTTKRLAVFDISDDHIVVDDVVFRG